MTAASQPLGHAPSPVPLIAAGFAISFVLIGGGIDTVSVFLNAVAAGTGWSRAALSAAVSVGAACAALSTPVVGIAVDRYGVRVPMLIGVGLLAIGFGVLMTMNEAWHFTAANVFLGPGFAACALLPLTVAVTVCVPHNTALALGIMGAGASAGALVLAPAVQLLVDAVGWRTAYMALGAAVVVTPLPFLAFALPRGRLRHHHGTAPATPAGRPIDGLRRPGVPALAAVMILPGLVAFSVSVHLVPYLASLGHPATTAAGALGAAIGVSAIGKLFGGYVADRIGALPTIRLALILWVAALAVLHHANSMAALAACVVLYGLALGTHIAVLPAIALGVLGSARFGTLFGILQLAAMLASAAGPVLSGYLFDSTGRYSSAVLVWVGVMALAAVVSFAMRPVAPPPAEERAVA